jgi:YD repeat-containing protein
MMSMWTSTENRPPIPNAVRRAVLKRANAVRQKTIYGHCAKTVITTGTLLVPSTNSLLTLRNETQRTVTGTCDEQGRLTRHTHSHHVGR